MARIGKRRTTRPAAPARKARVPGRRLMTAIVHPDGRRRCAWCGTDPLYVAYHDAEWGVPLHDDRLLFEMLCLEGAQAGLSWITVLRKRAGYRAAFEGFDAARMARYDARRRAALLLNPAIVRNRLKVEAFVTNARAYLAVVERAGTFDHYVWQFTDGRTLRARPRPRGLGDIPAATPVSDVMSRALKADGFKFVGTTICYAFMQAVGIVDDHQAGCFAASSRPSRRTAETNSGRSSKRVR